MPDRTEYPATPTYIAIRFGRELASGPPAFDIHHHGHSAGTIFLGVCMVASTWMIVVFGVG